MTTQAAPSSTAILIHAVAAALEAVARVLEAAALRLDAWREARRRAVQARIDLAAMSERELRDIGLDRGQVDAVAEGWPG